MKPQMNRCTKRLGSPVMGNTLPDFLDMISRRERAARVTVYEQQVLANGSIGFFPHEVSVVQLLKNKKLNPLDSSRGLPL